MKRLFSAVFAVVFIVTSAVLVSPITALADPIWHYDTFVADGYKNDIWHIVNGSNDEKEAAKLPGVYQGLESSDPEYPEKGGTHFAPSNAPQSSIVISEKDIDNDDARNSAKFEKLYNGPYADYFVFVKDGNLDNVFSFNQRDAADPSKNPSPFVLKRGDGSGYDGPGIPGKSDNVNYFDGPLASYTYVDAATWYHEDGTEEKCDVVFTYSNLRIAVQHADSLPVGNPGDTEIDKDDSIKNLVFSLFCGNNIHVGGSGHQKYNADPGYTSKSRYGIEVDVNIQVLRKNGTAVPDEVFYMRAADIDIRRDPVSNPSFGKIANALNGATNKSIYYSETITLRSGYDTSSGYAVFVPGKPTNVNNPSFPGDTSNHNYGSNNTPIYHKGYKCEVFYTAPTGNNPAQYTFRPTLADYIRTSLPNDSYTESDNGGFYSGFMCVANNNTGINLTVRSAGSTSATVNTYLFADYSGVKTMSPTNHQLMSSTGAGGNIFSTSTGKKGLINVAAGSTVTYRMTPNPGFTLKSVTQADGTVIHTENGYDITGNVNVVKDANGNVLYYEFTFANISEDHAIHVEWEPITKEIEVEKHWQDVPEDARPADLKFQLLKTNPATGGYRDTGITITITAPDWKGKFTDLPSTETDGTPIAYHVRELVPDGYVSDAPGNIRAVAGTNDIGGSYGVAFTNAKGASPKIDVEVNKSWVGDTEADRPAELTFTLNANGMPLQTITVSPDPTGVWKGGFSNLPVKDDAKEPIVYSITEYVPAGYTCSHNEAQVTSRSATFINTKAPTPTVSDPNAPQQTYTITLPVDPIAYLDPEEPVIEPYVEPEPPAPEPEQAPVWTDPGTYATPLSSTAPAEEEDPEPAYLVQGDSLSPPTGDNAPLVPLVLTVAGLCGTVWALDKKKRSLR